MSENLNIIIQEIKDDVRELRNDVKNLIEFKGKILGIIAVSSSVISVLVGIITKFLEK